MKKLSRRSFLKAMTYGGVSIGLGSGLFRVLSKRDTSGISGKIVGANWKTGHLLRRNIQVKPNRLEKISTVIIGGGVSGLSAAWWLKRNNYDDFVLLEMEESVGGNAISGSNQVSAYPWGAHYVPLAGPEADYLKLFFEEVGVIKGYANGLPIYDEFALCSEPAERLFFQGQWRDGLLPQYGVRDEDKRQYGEFFSYVQDMKNAQGSDGRPAFTIPLERSSRDPKFRELDRISMAEFMRSKGWHSQYLNWYVNYCCRDDYGVGLERVSAWAGIHYFASRSAVAVNAEASTVLTWPEGNGYLVNRLKNLTIEQIRSNTLAYSVETSSSGCVVDCLDTAKELFSRIEARNVIYAAPRFTANRVIKGYYSPVLPEYSPWMVANITVSEIPDGVGAALAWDNVNYYSRSLGYIVANHQDLTINRKEKVLTYYLPLDELTPEASRVVAYQKSYEDWLNIIVPDLERFHRGIKNFIQHVDVWIWGHGMVSPGIGYLWGGARDERLKPFGNVFFANSDMSGLSIFEEAQYRGVEAAKSVLTRGQS